MADVDLARLENLIARLRSGECSHEIDAEIHAALGRAGNPKWIWDGREVIPAYSRPPYRRGRGKRPPDAAERVKRLADDIMTGKLSA